MQKRIYLLAFMAAAAAFSACGGYDASLQPIPSEGHGKHEPGQPSGPVEIVLCGTASSGEAFQKTALDADGNSVVFTGSEVLSLFDADKKNCPLELKSKSDDGSTAFFRGQVTQAADCYTVLYPYQQEAEIDGDGAITAEFPSSQKAIGGTFDPAANLSVAVCSDGKSFCLQNVGALLRLTTTESFDQIDVVAQNGVKISGKVQISFDDNGKPCADETSEGTDRIELHPASGSAIGPGTYYVVLRPANLEQGLEIVFHKDGEATSTTGKRFVKGMEFERSKGKNCGELVTANGVFIPLVKVSGGTFWMGAQASDPAGQNYDANAQPCEGAVHEVTLSDFYISQTEVSQALWKAVNSALPSGLAAAGSDFKGDTKPVCFVSYADAADFISNLNKLTGRLFALPTEAEWEFAARGGNSADGGVYSGSPLDEPEDVGLMGKTSGNPQEVAKCSPNELMLYDMSGNVYEWCRDSWQGQYSDSKKKDPVFADAASKVLRGGSFDADAADCRVSARIKSEEAQKDFGLRLSIILSGGFGSGFHDGYGVFGEL